MSGPLTLTVLSGLPGSGKSTLARRLASESEAMVVSRDDLRQMIQVLDEAELTIRLIQLSASFLRNRISIVVDSWNLHPADRVRWTELAQLSGAKLNWIHLDVPVEVCIYRDARRPAPNGESAIRSAAEINARQLRVLSQEDSSWPMM